MSILTTFIPSYVKIRQSSRLWHSVPRFMWGMDIVGEGVLSINTIYGNNDITTSELTGSTYTITGIVTGEPQTSVVSTTINGTYYSADVQSNLTWALTVNESDLTATTSFTVTLAGEDIVGNPISDTATRNYSVSLAPIVYTPYSINVNGGGTWFCHSRNDSRSWDGLRLGSGTMNAGTIQAVYTNSWALWRAEFSNVVPAGKKVRFDYRTLIGSGYGNRMHLELSYRRASDSVWVHWKNDTNYYSSSSWTDTTNTYTVPTNIDRVRFRLTDIGRGSPQVMIKEVTVL